MCHSYSLFPFYTPLSLPSLLSFSYVPALFFFTFFTLCELREKRVTSINELQVARSDSFRKSMSWAFYFAYVGHTLCPCVKFFILSILFIFFLLFTSLSLSFPFLTMRSVALIRSAHLTGPAIISLVPTRGTLSRSSWLVCDLIPSHLLFLFRSFPISILGSTMRVTSNRNAATTKSSIGRICTACTVCIWRGNSSRYYGIVLLLFCNRCTMALCNEESIIAVSSKEGACTRCQNEPFFLSTHRVIAPH